MTAGSTSSVAPSRGVAYGYAFAPLAHGAVIAPSAVTELSTAAAGTLLGEILTRSHVAAARILALESKRGPI